MKTEEVQEKRQTEADLKQLASDIVRQAMQRGASAAEAVISEGSEFSTLVRLGEVETLKEAGARAAGLRVFLGQRAASTHTSDLSRDGIEQMVSSVLTLARVTRCITARITRQGTGRATARWNRADCEHDNHSGTG